jgi:uncharacterized membrane protein
LSEANETARVEAFSDGVLAIVITLLVLEIKVPELSHGVSDAALGAALLHLLPKVLAWVVSFLFIFVFWVSHHDLFARIRRVDRGLLWWNGLFLLAVSFTPFPTALVGEHPDSRWAVALLGGAFALSGLFFTGMRHHVSLRVRSLDLPDDAIRRALRRGRLSPILYGLATLLAFASPRIALVMIALIPFLFVAVPKPRQRS